MLITILLLTTVFIFPLSSKVLLIANQNYNTNYLVYLSSDEFISEEIQLSRLLELQEIVNSYNNYGVVPHNINNFPEYMPKIEFLAAPSDSPSGVFYIGLYICHGDISYDKRHGEEMTKIINTPIPSETVDFILDFAQIPYEDAKVFHTVFIETPLWPLDEPLPADRIDPWEYDNTNTALEPY